MSTNLWNLIVPTWSDGGAEEAVGPAGGTEEGAAVTCTGKAEACYGGSGSQVWPQEGIGWDHLVRRASLKAGQRTSESPHSRSAF